MKKRIIVFVSVILLSALLLSAVLMLSASDSYAAESMAEVRLLSPTGLVLPTFDGEVIATARYGDKITKLAVKGDKAKEKLTELSITYSLNAQTRVSCVIETSAQNYATAVEEAASRSGYLGEGLYNGQACEYYYRVNTGGFFVLTALYVQDGCFYTVQLINRKVESYNEETYARLTEQLQAVNVFAAE